MRKNSKIKLSKKTKRQILEYLNYKQNLLYDKLCDFKFAFFDMYNSEINFIEQLMTDIELYGVK